MVVHEKVSILVKVCNEEGKNNVDSKECVRDVVRD